MIHYDMREQVLRQDKTSLVLCLANQSLHHNYDEFMGIIAFLSESLDWNCAEEQEDVK